MFEWPLLEKQFPTHLLWKSFSYDFSLKNHIHWNGFLNQFISKFIFIGSLMEHRQWLDVSFKEFLLEAMMDLRFIFLGISLISKSLSWNMTSTSFSNIFFTWPSQLFSRIISYGDSCFRLHLHCVKGVHIRSFFWSAFSRIGTEYGEISPYHSVFSLGAEKYGPEKTPYLDTFHAVWLYRI